MSVKHFAAAVVSATCIALSLFSGAAAQGGTGQPNVGEAKLDFDVEGRPTAPVTINGKGPFTFVVDTAAQRAGLSQEIIETLAIMPAKDGRSNLQGSSGATTVPTYTLDSVGVAGVSREDVMALPLVHGRTSDAVGVLGADTFLDKRVEFDFGGGLLKVDADPARSTPLGFATAPVQLLYGTFAIADVEIAGVKSRAVIDTGAKRTVGNAQLMKALGYREGDPRLHETEAVRGVAGGESIAAMARVSNFTIAGQSFGDLQIGFSGLSVFQALGLNETPAMILGNDFFRDLKALAIDYGRGEIQVRR